MADATPQVILDAVVTLAAAGSFAEIQQHAQYPGNVKPRPALQAWWAKIEKTGREGGASGARLRYEGTLNLVVVEPTRSQGGDPWGKINTMVSTFCGTRGLSISATGVVIESTDPGDPVAVPPSQDDNRVDWVAVLLPLYVAYTVPDATI